MTKYGLRARVIVLTLASTLSIGLLLSGYFTTNRYQEIEAQLNLSGQAIIESLALASEIGLINESRENVRRLIGYTHRHNSEFIRSIAVFSSNHRLFVTSNYHRHIERLSLPADTPLPEHLETSRDGETLLMRAPIRAIGGFSTNISTEKPLGYITMEIDLSSAKLKQYREIIAASVILVLGLISSWLFSYRLLTYVEQPIQQMISMIDRIRRGHLDVRIEGMFFGELDTLKKGINAMAISLSEYHSDMQQSIDQATSDLRKTAERMEIQNVQLGIATREAKEASRVKSEFLANMSHELRTPLNSVLGFTSQMLKTTLTASQKDQLQTIEKSANNLLSIINDILDFSKLEANKLQIENIAFGLEENLYDVMHLIAPMAHDKGLELNLRLDHRVPAQLMGDRLRIQQVLINLIGNATKFTDRGNISISVDLKRQTPKNVVLQFSIVDTGIGISEKQQEHLFAAFSQADASINRRYGGTGLGLVITKKLVHQMGGEIGFSSRLHHGSTFWFEMPFDFCGSELSPVQPIDWAKNKTILLIEPNRVSRQTIFERLKGHGFDVRSPSSLPEHYDDVYALIYNLPANNQSDPTELYRLATKARQLSECVIFGLPANKLFLEGSLLEHGVQSCLCKPINIEKLLNLLTPTKEISQQIHMRTATPVAKTSAKVLAVDDNSANLKLLSVLLADHVETVELANCGSAAIKLAMQQNFDLILMDIQMPDMDGVSASQKIRQTPLNKSTQIIAVTAHVFQEEKERLLAAGMDGYLTKPIDENALISLLCQWKKEQAALNSAPRLSPIPAPTSNQSIHWQHAVQQSAGKTEVAQELLQMLVDSFADVETCINRALEEGDDNLCAEIHKLHGSSAYSGVPALKRLCFEVETQLKKGASIEAIEPELFELLDEMEKIKLQAPEFLHSHSKA